MRNFRDFTAEAYELGGIVLLGRNLQTDYLEELNPSEKVLRVMQRMISPAWTERQLSENLFLCRKSLTACRYYIFSVQRILLPPA